MALGLWWPWEGCPGLGSCAEQSCSCGTQVRRGCCWSTSEIKMCLVMFWTPILSCARFSDSAIDWKSRGFSALSALFLATSSTLSKLPWRIQPLGASNSENGFSGLWITCLCPCISLRFCQTEVFIFWLREAVRGGRVEKREGLHSVQEAMWCFLPSQSAVSSDDPAACPAAWHSLWWAWKCRSTCSPLTALSFSKRSMALLQHSKPAWTWALGVLHQAAILLIFMFFFKYSHTSFY